MSRPFPPGTELYDVEGIPVAAVPGDPPRRYDRPTPESIDAQFVAGNGLRVPEEAFWRLVRQARSDRR